MHDDDDDVEDLDDRERRANGWKPLPPRRRREPEQLPGWWSAAVCEGLDELDAELAEEREQAGW